MNLSALPDTIGMLILMSILGWARRHYGAQIVNRWLLGLALVLAANVSSALCTSALLPGRWFEAGALDCTVLAGMFFAFAGGSNHVGDRRLLALAAAALAPLIVLASGFALGYDSPRVSAVIIVIAFLIGLLAFAWASLCGKPVRGSLLLAHCAVWPPMLMLVLHHEIRGAVYWGMGCLYLAVAYAFRRDVRKDCAGGVVLVAGFATWAACLFLHPVAVGRPGAAAFLDHVLAMQKFFVILGMLLVLLETETRLRQDEAMHDALTGLPNRRLFADRLSVALERSRRSGLTTALVTLDLNGFKQINDTMGHRFGDLVLKATAEHLRTRVRTSDTLSRCGGDEFCIILGDIARPEDCARVVEILRDAVAHSIDARCKISCSIGYALFPQDATDAETLAELADRRMYENKRGQIAPRPPAVVLALSHAG